MPVPHEVLDDFSPEIAEQGCLFEIVAAGMLSSQPPSGLSYKNLTSVSHPSVQGRLAPGLIKDLRAYYARLDQYGRVIELTQVTPFEDGGPVIDNDGSSRVDNNGNPIYVDAFVLREYPPLNGTWSHVRLLLDVNPSREDFLLWMGGAHRE